MIGTLFDILTTIFAFLLMGLLTYSVIKIIYDTIIKKVITWLRTKGWRNVRRRI